MSPEALLGLDLGGSGIRSLVWHPREGILALAFRSWDRAQRPVGDGLGDEIDLDALFAEVASAVREAREAAGGAGVAGVAVSAIRFATVVLDLAGRPLLAASNRDGRGVAASLRWAAEGPALHARTGHWPSAIATAARLAWLAERAPADFAKVGHCLGLGDWLTWRLCGELASEPSVASGTLLYDLSAGRWDADLAARAGARLGWLPPLRAPGERLGPLRREAADALGLRAGTPVAVGSADTQCALLAAGACRPSDAALIAGSTAPVLWVTDRLRTDPDACLWTEPHLVAGRFVLESNAGPVGDSLAWCAGLLHPEAPVPVARLLAEAEAAEPGASGMLSTLVGDRMDGRRIGLPVGALALSPLAAPDPARARSDVARAVVENAAFSLRANLEALCALAEAGPARVRLAGGLARSPFFAGLVAEVLGRDVECGPTSEASALGAALCAGVGAGLFASLEEAATRLPAPARFAPDPARAERYDELFATWSRVREAQAAASERVAHHALPTVIRRRSGSATAAGRAPRPRILATADLDAAALERLQALGEVEYASFRERMRLLTGPDLAKALEGVEVFVTEVDVLDAAALLDAPALRVVAACRGDAVNVDVAACTALGIPVLFAPGRNAEAVADLTLAFLLALARRLPEAADFLRDPELVAGDLGRMGQAFRTLRGRELGGRTVGLVGFGAVGRAVARRLRAFGARVLVSDPAVSDAEALRADAERVPFDELLARSDFVSLHAAVTDASRGLVDAAALRRMRPGAFLVNTARAALVDEDALAEALREGHLAGAALDVFAVEPPGAEHPLLALPQVIATPHVGGNTAEVAGHQGRIVAEELGRLLRGERPRHVLDAVALEGFAWDRPRRVPDAREREALRSRPAPSVSDVQRDRRPAPRRARAAATPVASPGTGPPSPEEAARVPEATARMERVLGAFVERLAVDPALERFAAGKDVTLHFALSDLPLAFHLRLRGGRVTAGVGEPDAPAEVELRMRAAVLDGMFTGRVNAMQEAMSGGLSFSGDAGKAMTLQHVQGDLSRLYRAAREAAGDPGDLAALPRPGRAFVAAPAEDDLRHELVRVVGDLYAQELVTATGGNVSARIPGTEELWITPSQLFKGDLRPEILVRIGLDGRRLDPDALSPSSERMMHCAIYRAKPDARAVVHAHAPHATILANARLPFLPISTEAAFFGDIPRVPFVMPGTDALADAVARAMGDGWAVLLENHGLLVAGRSLRRAADMAEIIDRSARVMLGCWSVGREPPTLPDDVVAELRRMGDLVA